MSSNAPASGQGKVLTHFLISVDGFVAGFVAGPGHDMRYTVSPA